MVKRCVDVSVADDASYEFGGVNLVVHLVGVGGARVSAAGFSCSLSSAQGGLDHLNK